MSMRWRLLKAGVRPGFSAAPVSIGASGDRILPGSSARRSATTAWPKAGRAASTASAPSRSRRRGGRCSRKCLGLGWGRHFRVNPTRSVGHKAWRSQVESDRRMPALCSTGFDRFLAGPGFEIRFTSIDVKPFIRPSVSISSRAGRLLNAIGRCHRFCSLKCLRNFLVLIPETMNTPSPR